jgi:7-keto-8-aminopelargonate synthetase-like enzyme
MFDIIKKIFFKKGGLKPARDSLSILSDEAGFFVTNAKKYKILNPPFQGEDGFQGKIVKINGSSKVDLTRLDYLALGSNREIKNIMQSSIEKYDLSCPASQMVMKSQPNAELEKTIADFHGMKSTILFTSGYSANDNLMQALGQRLRTHYVYGYVKYILSPGSRMKGIGTAPTLFFVDDESHYSLNHGMRIAKYFSKGRCFVEKYPSTKYDILEENIQKSIKKYPLAVRIIVTDALSSISGKIFDIEKLNDISAKYGCILFVDEAHSTGVLGTNGRGVAYSAKNYQENKSRIVVMGTLTKAICQLGGYVTLENDDLATLLRVSSPQYIFSAPINPWLASVITKTIKLISGDFGEKKREYLSKISTQLRTKLKELGYDIMESDSQIVPVVIGDDNLAEKVKDYLEDNGFMTSLFKYPAVSQNKALIRFSLCADITEEEIGKVVELMKKVRDIFKIKI